MACYHRPWTIHISNDVGCGMPAWSLGSTHDGWRRAWHVIIAIGNHTRSNTVGCDMPSSPLDSTHCGTTLGVYAIIDD